MDFSLSMRDHDGNFVGSHMASGGQGEIYRIEASGRPRVLKVYLGQQEGELRLRELNDAFDLLTDVPPPVQRGLMIDCGNVQMDGRLWPGAMFKFVRGKPLYDPWESTECAVGSGRLSDQDRLALAYQLLEGVRYLHEHGVVHADLSPTNVIVEDSTCELTLIDLDGAGLIDTKRMGWKRVPLVLGQARVPGFPPPAEFWNDEVYLETDFWWTAMLSYYVLTSGNPFFFLDGDASPPSLTQLQELFEGETDSGWPPEYRLACRHPRFRRSISEADYNALLKYLNSKLPTNLLFLTFVPGYTDRSLRVSPENLLYELALRGEY